MKKGDFKSNFSIFTLKKLINLVKNYVVFHKNFKIFEKYGNFDEMHKINLKENS